MNFTKAVAVFSMVMVAASALGEDAKPTKAQTIEYIQMNYPQGFDYLLSQPFDSGRLGYSGSISETSININGSKVTVSYLSVLNYITTAQELKREQYLITFDLKDIEVIGGMTPDMVGLITYDDCDIGTFPMYLVFRAANSKPAISVTINGETQQTSAAAVPFDKDNVKENHRVLSEFNNSQLYKAFEHLRKLSGAPEPIRF